MIFKLIILNSSWGTTHCDGALTVKLLEDSLRWMPQNTFDDKSALFNGSGNHLSQCWLSCMSPYGLTMSQWVNMIDACDWHVNSCHPYHAHIYIYIYIYKLWGLILKWVAVTQIGYKAHGDIPYLFFLSNWYQWLSARLQYLQCSSNGNTAVLQ